MMSWWVGNLKGSVLARNGYSSDRIFSRLSFPYKRPYFPLHPSFIIPDQSFFKSHIIYELSIDVLDIWSGVRILVEPTNGLTIQ